MVKIKRMLDELQAHTRKHGTMSITPHQLFREMIKKENKMPKPKRNQPCPCGSGKKYKKCCLARRSRIMNEGPTNKFREELKNQAVSDAEMLERDQRATYLELKNQAEMRESDCLHLEEGIEKLKYFGNRIFRLPDSDARVAILEQNKRHMEQLEKQMEVSGKNRAQQVILSVLEEKFGKAAQPTAVVEPPDSEPKELKDD